MDKIYNAMETSENTGKTKKLTLSEYAELVKKMRIAQRQYFRTRNTKYLTRSKELEKQVDDETAKLLSTQLDLFHG